ncbi:MAG TPA: hypothetical protein VNZ45_18225 [Bacteroidia bacterium]|nr:hypothetical protein [Bacteroidia bacterium]
MHKAKIYSILLPVLLLLLFTAANHDAFAQKSDTVKVVSVHKDTLKHNDTNLIAKKEHKFLGFLSGLFHRYTKKTNQDTSAAAKKNAKRNDSIAAVHKKLPKMFDFTKGGITYTSLYTQGVSLNTGVSGLYNIAQVFQGFDIYGLPIKAEATGVMNNGQFEKDYSSYSISFDAPAFLNKLKQRSLDNLTNVQADERAISGKQHVSLADSMNSFESVRQQVNSPSYQADLDKAKTQLAIDEDSLKKNPNMDTTQLHGLKQKLAAAQQLEQRYNQLFAMKKNYSSLASSDTAVTNNENRYNKDKALLNNPGSIEKTLMASPQLSGAEKFLMGFKKFSIGLNSEDISEFTLHNFMMKGVDIAYKAGDVYISGGYGKEQAVINPYLMTGVNVPTYNRTVEYGRVGIGSAQSSNLYATVLQINDPGNPSSLGETNWVLDISKKIVCNKNLDFEGEVAQSIFKYLPTHSDTIPTPLTSKNDMSLAYALRGHAIIPYTNTIIKAEYANTGEDFITLGNPYLLTGAKIYSADITQPMGSKLKVGVGGAHTEQNLLNSDNAKQTDNWIDFSVAYKPNKTVNMELKYSPRQFQQQEGTVVANSLTSNIDQISFMCNASTRFLKKDEFTTLFIGNFQYNTPGSNLFLTQNLNLTYYMLNEIISLGSSNSIMIAANESRNGWTGSLSELINEGTYNTIIGKSLTTSGGLQWVEQPGVIANAIGVIGSIGKTFKKWGRFSLQLNCRNNMYRPFELKTAQIIVSTNACILW